MRMTKQFVPLFFIFLSFAIYSVRGATIYASPEGVQDAPCDIDTPCDIYFAVSYANESDVVICQEGQYYLSTPLTVEVANLTLIGQSQVNTTIEIPLNVSSGIRSKSTFHMQNFTIYTLGFQSGFNQYPIEIKEDSPSDFIEALVEDITFIGSFSQMYALIYIQANNGSATIRNININHVTGIYQQCFYVESPIATFDHINVMDSIGLYQVILVTTEELSVSNFILHNSTISSYVIQQREWNNSNISNNYLSSIDISNSTFYYFSFLGNITIDGCNITSAMRGYNLFYISAINKENSFVTVKNSNIKFLIDDGYYNYFFSGAENYTVEIDNCQITKAYFSLNYATSISFTNSYLLFCRFYMQAPVFYSRNSTYLEVDQFQFQFYFIDGNSNLKDPIYGSFYVTNSSFINSPPDTYSTTVYLTNDYYNTQIITPVNWIDTMFYLVSNPFFYYNGNMPVTYENCYFSTISTIRGTEGANYISSCPGGTVTVNGSDTYWAWGAEMVSFYQSCDLVCAPNVQFICDDFSLGGGGGGDFSINTGFLILMAIIALVVIGAVIGSAIIVIIRRRARRTVLRRITDIPDADRLLAS